MIGIVGLAILAFIVPAPHRSRTWIPGSYTCSVAAVVEPTGGTGGGPAPLQATNGACVWMPAHWRYGRAS